MIFQGQVSISDEMSTRWRLLWKNILGTSASQVAKFQLISILHARRGCQLSSTSGLYLSLPSPSAISLVNLYKMMEVMHPSATQKYEFIAVEVSLGSGGLWMELVAFS